MTMTFSNYCIILKLFRIDDLIKLAPEKGEEKSYQQAYADGSLNG